MFILLAFTLKKFFPHIFSWPSKAVKHIKQLHHTVSLGRWGEKAAILIMEISSLHGDENLAFRTTVNMYLCKYTPTTVPHHRVPNTWRHNGTSLFMVSDSFNNSCLTKRFTALFFTARLLSTWSLLGCPLSPFALSTSAFYSCCSNHIKNLVIIVPKSNQSSNTTTEMRAMAWRDLFWSRKTNHVGGCVVSCIWNNIFSPSIVTQNIYANLKHAR